LLGAAIIRHVVVIAVVVLVALAILTYAANPLGTASLDPRARILGVTVFRMPSRSMEPTIKSDSIFLVSVRAYVRDEPKVGDVVVFDFPPNRDISYVKRIIATGGATVEIRDSEVFVNGKAVTKPYVVKESAQTDHSRNMPPLRVPPNSYFVLGDNRDNSSDSRDWGFVPRDHIFGRVVRQGSGT
jgi:signal peptidase I